MLLLEMQSIHYRVIVEVQKGSQKAPRGNHLHEEELGRNQSFPRSHPRNGWLLLVKDGDNEEGNGRSLFVEREFKQDVREIW